MQSLLHELFGFNTTQYFDIFRLFKKNRYFDIITNL